MRSLVALCILLLAPAAHADVRIKDITAPVGPRDYQLIGYGLVIGLQGTGDTLRNAPFTEQSASALLDRMGVNVKPNNTMRTRNVAAVMVTSSLPPFVSWGSTIDVTVSSLGDATSLMGGTLVLTSLTGIDGSVYAIAQGPIAVSGFAAQGQNETLTHGVATVGRIPNGATIEREPPRPTAPVDDSLVLQLRNPDYTTSVRIADAVNAYTRARYKAALAQERDDRSVLLSLPKGTHATRFLAEIGDLRVAVETPARVVIDERTGTVVIGADVQISPVAVTQGGLTIRITETPEVSQPAPLSNGRTAVTTQTTISAAEKFGQVAVFAGPTLKQLVRGLNEIGLKPTGIISILQAIKSAGALQADLVIQ